MNVRLPMTLCCVVAACLAFGHVAGAAHLNVDFSSDDPTPGPLQEGFQEFEGAYDLPADPITLTFASGLGVGGFVDVTVTDPEYYRDRFAMTGGAYVGLNNLLSDGVERVTDGAMTLTLEDLLAGSYWITTYHHNTKYAGKLLDINVTDADGYRVVAEDVRCTTGTAPAEIAMETFAFRSDGSPVDIGFVVDSSEGGIICTLNGFEVVIPEPSTVVFLVSGMLLGLVFFRRHRMWA